MYFIFSWFADSYAPRGEGRKIPSARGSLLFSHYRFKVFFVPKFQKTFSFTVDNGNTKLSIFRLNQFEKHYNIPIPDILKQNIP